MAGDGTVPVTTWDHFGAGVCVARVGAARRCTVGAALVRVGQVVVFGGGADGTPGAVRRWPSGSLPVEIIGCATL